MLKNKLHLILYYLTATFSAMSYDIIDIPSTNFNSRQGSSANLIILHCVGLDLEATLKGFAYQDPAQGGLGASPHYFIPQISAHHFMEKAASQFNIKVLLQHPTKVPVIRFVHEENRAWHAGLSSWGAMTDLNSHSIGIEFHAPGYGNEGKDWFDFTPFTESQIETGAALMLDICERQRIDQQQIWGHSDIAPVRKTDPGPLFPWKLLYDKYRLGIWPSAVCPSANLTIPQIKGKLLSIGYSMSDGDNWTTHDRHVVNAFRMHFMQDTYQRPTDPLFGEIDSNFMSKLSAFTQY